MDQRDKRNPESEEATETSAQRPGEDASPRDGASRAAAEGAEPSDTEPEVLALSPEEQELATLRAQLEETQARLRAVSKAYTDLQGENKIFRDRVEQQATIRQERRAFDLAKAFFDPVMNLKRSMLQPGQDLESLLDGLKIVQHQFMLAMDKLGLEEVPGVGADFDPNVHEALAVSPVADPDQDGKILMVHNDGYTVRGKVLQAAQVVIGKYHEVAGEA